MLHAGTQGGGGDRPFIGHHRRSMSLPRTRKDSCRLWLHIMDHTQTESNPPTQVSPKDLNEGREIVKSKGEVMGGHRDFGSSRGAR